MLVENPDDDLKLPLRRQQKQQGLVSKHGSKQRLAGGWPPWKLWTCKELGRPLRELRGRAGDGFWLSVVYLFVVLFSYIKLQLREKGLKDEQLSECLVWYREWEETKQCGTSGCKGRGHSKSNYYNMK